VLESGGRSERPDLDPIVLLIEATLRRAGKGKRLVIENGGPASCVAARAVKYSSSFDGRKDSWLPFLDTYRTMCLAPQPDFRRVLAGVLAMELAA
jgi:hypothetical protein